MRNPHLTAQRCMHLVFAGRMTRHDAVTHVWRAMDKTYRDEWPQAARDWAIELVAEEYRYQTSLQEAA